MGYTKLFDDIVASSVWDEDDKTRLVWVTMLALKNRDHYVRATLTYLALASRVSVEDCQKAIVRLSSPDGRSRTPDYGGRRIQEAPGGWIVLNGAKYQGKLSLEERREYNRRKQAEYRKRRKEIQESGACAGAQQAIAEGLSEASSESVPFPEPETGGNP